MRLHFGAAASAASLLAVHAARSQVGPIDTLLRADDAMAVPYVSEPLAFLVRRQAPPASSAAGRNEPGHDVRILDSGKINVTQWNMETDEACKKALGKLPRSTNPSGNCVCYNLPSLDTKTGVFEAELRLYRISEPRGDFADVKASDINVGVQYPSASVSPIKPSELMGVGLVHNKTKVIRPRAEADGPQLIQAYMFIGQINKDKMKGNMSMVALESLVIPTFTLKALKANGANISTNVSLNEASFLTGAFSGQVILSDFSAAQQAVNKEVEALRNGTVAFVLPGVQILIFPVGLIITSVWLLVGTIAYGYGTYERMIYADMYKRRLQRSAMAAQKSAI